MTKIIFDFILLNIFYFIDIFSVIISFFTLILIQRISKKEKVYLLSAYSFSILGLLLGARILFITENIITNNKDLYGGYSYMGAIIGYLLFLKIYVFLYKKCPSRVINLLKLPVFEIYGISKIGCYFSKCCNGFIKVPIQLIESVLYLLVFYITFKLYKTFKNKDNGICFGYILFCIIRFIIDFIRINRKVIFYNITLSQIVCIGLMIIYVIKIIQNNKKIAIVDGKNIK